ncbi:ABC transporter permease [Caviibacter abscessus]|uniref:ABC transporter permease n=1 Tax=Caviibacter abscessus TaxID=1766719 RepID=UPI00082DF108|nr:iron ABC transporter permease [Caviibacter abscessus]
MEINKKKWEILSYILLGLVISPIIYIFLNTLNKNSEYSNEIFNYLLKDYVINTLIILFPTVIIATIIGVSLSYFETFYEYRFRKFFKYANIMVFAIPSYILAYMYVDIFNGPIYNLFGLNIDIANKKGAIIILSLSFYPYVYLICRAYMKKISMNILNSSRILGKSNFETFFKIILPLSRPAVITGASLVIMETLNAYGVPSYFGISVFSTGIHTAWVNSYDLDAAIKLSAILMLFVFIFIFFERYLRNVKRYTLSGKIEEIKREKLKGVKEYLLLICLFSLFCISFVIPLAYIFRLFKLSIPYLDMGMIIELTKNTIYILLISTIFIVLLSLFLTNVVRLKKNKYRWIVSNISSIGYSIPGSVIAIGFLSIFISIDNFLISKNLTQNILIIKSPLVIILAYTTRFLSLSYNGIEANINKIGNDYHKASRVLGKTAFTTFFKVDLIMLKSAVVTSFLLVSIEIIKELPLTSLLLVKNTLAIQIKNYASDEEMVLTAPLSLVLILICFILLMVYNKIEDRGERK